MQGVGALRRLDREVGPGDVADQQRVAAQQHPWLGAAAEVGDQEGQMLGAVPGRGHRLQTHRAGDDLVTRRDNVGAAVLVEPGR